MDLSILKKYTKETGIEIIYARIEVYKHKPIVYRCDRLKVLISDEKNYVAGTKHGSLNIIEKQRGKYSSYCALNKMYVGEQTWRSSLLDDYLHATVYSSFSEKVTKNRLKKALFKYIREKAYFYSEMQEKIREALEINS